jgi:hypothetical protein
MIDDTNLRTWQVPPQRRAADKMLLAEVMAEPNSPKQRSTPRLHLTRRAILVVSLVGGIITAGGVAAAVVTLRPQNPSVRDTARCYSKVSTNFSSSFPGGEVGIAQQLNPATNASVPTNTDVPSQVISLCATMWSWGFSKPGIGAPRTSENNPVPSLVACVLPSGEAAVFPGNAATCTKLGLPVMSRQGTPEQVKTP